MLPVESCLLTKGCKVVSLLASILASVLAVLTHGILASVLAVLAGSLLTVLAGSLLAVLAHHGVVHLRHFILCPAILFYQMKNCRLVQGSLMASVGDKMSLVRFNG